MLKPHAHMCVLICTADRPELLRRLLIALTPQVNAMGCPTVIVDNGFSSAEAVVAEFRSDMDILYHRLPERGLVAARNTSIRLAMPMSPDYLVFIDDDEAPDADWLANLIACADRTGAGIVTGPVVPAFAIAPPAWAISGEFFRGAADGLATSNLLLRASILPENESAWFHPDFNVSGGEDDEFLNRLLAGGATHIPADNAKVSEWVPAERMRLQYFLRCGLRDGAIIVQISAQRNASRIARLTHIAGECCAKLAYGINHVLWSIVSPWRLVRAGQDFAIVAGIVLRLAGFKFVFYGRPSEPAAARR